MTTPSDVGPLSGAPILVTGAGGFMGSHLCRHLLSMGLETHGTWRGRPPPGGVRSHQVDLADPEGCAALFQRVRPATVFHLASPVDLSRDPELFPRLLPGILSATHHVACGCLAVGARLVATCTCEVYGDGPVPFHEGQLPRPVSPYSALKAAASTWLMSMARVAGLEVTVVRPFLTYGPGQPPVRLVPAAVEAAIRGEPLEMTAGTQTREFNFIEDQVRGLILASAPAVSGEILNLGGGPERPVLEVARMIYRLAGQDPALVRPGRLSARPGEATRFYGAHSKMEALLGHRPRVGLEDGLRRTIDAARDHVVA